MKIGIIYKFKSYITNHKRKVSGSSPECPTNDMGVGNPPRIYNSANCEYSLSGDTFGSLYRSIRTIGVMVTSLPSKQMSSVRSRYRAPRRDLSAIYLSRKHFLSTEWLREDSESNFRIYKRV